MRVEFRELSRLRPYEGNPRVTDDAVGPVADAIREFGFRQPIVVDTADVIVVGHVRYLAAQKLGLKKVPVHIARDLSPEQLRAYRIADNKLHELSKWNQELLSIELSELRAAELDFSLLGFDVDAVAELLGHASDPAPALNVDDIPEPPDKAVTQPGDLWILGDHRLLCGDSASPHDVDRLLDGSRVELVNSDPPYNVKVEPRSNNAIAGAGRRHHQEFDRRRSPGKANRTTKKLRPKDRSLANDFLSDADFERRLKAWFGNFSRALVPGGSFYIWGGYANCANYPPALVQSGLYFSQAIIWIKEHPVLTRKDFMGNHEWCFYGWREGGRHRFFGPRNLADVWQVTRAWAGGVSLGRGVRLEARDGSRLDVLPPGSGKLQTVRLPESGMTVYGGNNATDVWSVKKVTNHAAVHLTEKPVELAQRAMRYSSRPGESVLDLFGGSGSTLIAAQQTQRKAFLMELDPLYCDVIVARWEKLTGKKAKRSPVHKTVNKRATKPARKRPAA